MKKILFIVIVLSSIQGSADLNQDGLINILDIIELLNIILN